MSNWIAKAVVASFLSLVVNSSQCQSQPVPTPTAAPEQSIQVKVVGAKTYSEKHIGGVGAISGNRARIINIFIQVPEGLTFRPSNIDENVDEGVFTLQDSQGKHYIFGDQSSAFGILHKNNVLEIYCICAYRSVPAQERNSLRIKTRLYFYDRSSSGKSIGSRWLDIPVKYYP